MLISVSNTLLAVVTGVCAILILPSLEAFDNEAKEWYRCETFEKACNEFEGLEKEGGSDSKCDDEDLDCMDPLSRPAVSSMTLFYVCTPMSYLVLTLVFATNVQTRRFVSKWVNYNLSSSNKITHASSQLTVESTRGNED